jgi:predicted nucleotidyltransferase
MSGNAVQRGELAIVDKYERAKMALLSGVDLVLELPFPWCSASAESFAACGVKIAAEYADTLIFGSECGDTEPLKTAASICADEAFADEYKATLKGNRGAAEVYFKMLTERTGREYSSNDILGIEYIKAALRSHSKLSFMTVKREGSAYLSDKIEEGAFQSASALRMLAARGMTDELLKYMPTSAAEILMACAKKEELASLGRLDTALKLYFRLVSAERLSGIAELDGGLANRIKQAAIECGDESLIDALKTKRYTDSKLRRAMLFALTGVTTADVKSSPAYTVLLGANARGRELLSAKRKTAELQIVTKPADIPEISGAARQRELSLALDSVFSLALETPVSLSRVVARSPIII